LQQSGLADFDCQLRYVPIIMPPHIAHRYPARSKARKIQRICDCAPQLNYEIFVSGNFGQQITEYVAGIRTSGPILARLGASAAQIEELDRILSNSVQHILVNQRDQTRH
jgi:replication fork clamp-binding protein CrfC